MVLPVGGGAATATGADIATASPASHARRNDSAFMDRVSITGTATTGSGTKIGSHFTVESRSPAMWAITDHRAAGRQCAAARLTTPPSASARGCDTTKASGSTAWTIVLTLPISRRVTTQ